MEILKNCVDYSILSTKELIEILKENETYIKSLENGLMNALDKLSTLDKNFDYYDILRELTNWGNYKALEFLEKFEEN